MMRKLLMLTCLCILPLICRAGVDSYSLEVLERYPHDAQAYTQGLFFHNAQMFETTGLKRHSTLRKVDYSTGKVEKKADLPSNCFGEGSCMVDGEIYVLSWQNHLAFAYDPVTFECKRKFSYPREGWGLASLPKDRRKDFSGAVMVASDGSSNLYFLDSSFKTVKKTAVTFNGRALSLLNELEWIDGRIWANVYTTDMIVVIDPSSGRVVAKIDCSSLVTAKERTPSMDVLNGIAYLASPDGKGGSVFLTGKNWPWMFRVRLVRRK